MIQQHAPDVKSFIQAKAIGIGPCARRTGQEPDEIESPGQSGTCLLGDQADLWVGQSPLPQTQKEYQLALHQLRLGESVPDAPTAIGGNVGASAWPQGPSDGR